MAARLSTTDRVGLALMVAPIAWLGGWAGWHNTRSWYPLDAHISLSRGHIRTAEFKVNLDGGYTIALSLESSDRLPGSSDSDCWVSPILAPWSLSNPAAVVATGDGRPDPNPRVFWSTKSLHSLGDVHLNPGRYVLDLDVRDDQSQLNSLRPSLVVYESGGKFIDSTAQGAYALTALLLMIPVGICVMIRSGIVRHQEKSDAFARSCRLTQPGTLPGDGVAFNFRARNPRSLRPSPFLKTGWFGLAGATTYSLGCMVMIVLQSFDSGISLGFRVHAIRPEVKLVNNLGIQPVLVRVAFDPRDRRTSLYVDLTLVAMDDFATRLQQELSRRPPNWPVYLEGDRDMEWESVARTIDVIRGIGAEVVLLTPGTKSENRR